MLGGDGGACPTCDPSPREGSEGGSEEGRAAGEDDGDAVGLGVGYGRAAAGVAAGGGTRARGAPVQKSSYAGCLGAGDGVGPDPVRRRFAGGGWVSPPAGLCLMNSTSEAPPVISKPVSESELGSGEEGGESGSRRWGRARLVAILWYVELSE